MYLLNGMLILQMMSVLKSKPTIEIGLNPVWKISFLSKLGLKLAVENFW